MPCLDLVSSIQLLPGSVPSVPEVLQTSSFLLKRMDQRNRWLEPKLSHLMHRIKQKRCPELVPRWRLVLQPVPQHPELPMPVPVPEPAPKPLPQPTPGQQLQPEKHQELIVAQLLIKQLPLAVAMPMASPQLPPTPVLQVATFTQQPTLYLRSLHRSQ